MILTFIGLGVGVASIALYIRAVVLKMNGTIDNNEFLSKVKFSQKVGAVSVLIVLASMLIW